MGGLDLNEVNAVKGVVIAGRTKGHNKEHLKRHISQPVYDDIEFMTLDDLGKSLFQISKDLA